MLTWQSFQKLLSILSDKVIESEYAISRTWKVRRKISR